MLKMRSQMRLLLTAILLAFPSVAKALDVEVSPASPQQGDTI